MTAARIAVAAPPTDADLLTTTASLLDAMPGARLTQPLSNILEYVCSISAPEGRDRAVQLTEKLTNHLVDGMALRPGEASRAALDDWAGCFEIRRQELVAIGSQNGVGDFFWTQLWVFGEDVTNGFGHIEIDARCFLGHFESPLKKCEEGLDNRIERESSNQG